MYVCMYVYICIYIYIYIYTHSYIRLHCFDAAVLQRPEPIHVGSELICSELRSEILLNLGAGTQGQRNQETAIALMRRTGPLGVCPKTAPSRAPPARAPVSFTRCPRPPPRMPPPDRLRPSEPPGILDRRHRQAAFALQAGPEPLRRPEAEGPAPSPVTPTSCTCVFHVFFFVFSADGLFLFTRMNLREPAATARRPLGIRVLAKREAGGAECHFQRRLAVV